MAKTDPDSDLDGFQKLVKFLAGIMKEVGLPGFIILVLTSCLILWSTPDQQEEFVDSWILLKSTQENPRPCVIWCVGLVAIIVIGKIYYSKMVKIQKEENNRIGREKSELHEKMLGMKLESSDN